MKPEEKEKIKDKTDFKQRLESIKELLKDAKEGTFTIAQVQELLKLFEKVEQRYKKEIKDLKHTIKMMKLI